MGRTKNAMLRAVSALLVCRAALAMDVDVEDFGAKADNKTLSSVGINAALKAVSARGGGVVHVRAKGTYRAARVELQSHTELRIGPKTVLYASDAEED